MQELLKDLARCVKEIGASYGMLRMFIDVRLCFLRVISAVVTL